MEAVNGSTSELKLDSAPKQRGAVEEIISKRLKTLTKKIVGVSASLSLTIGTNKELQYCNTQCGSTSSYRITPAARSGSERVGGVD